MDRKEFVDEFLNVFAKNISNRQKRKIGLKISSNGEYCGKGYLWNIFSFGLVPCFEGDEARAKYDEADKTGAVEIQYDVGLGRGDDYVESLSQEFTTSKALDRYGYIEFYIIGKDFSWVYILTHEFDLCGPYFAYKPLN